MIGAPAQAAPNTFGYVPTIATVVGNVLLAVFTPVHACRLISPRWPAATPQPVGRASPTPFCQLRAPRKARTGACPGGGTVGASGPILPPEPNPPLAMK